ncbi:MAG: hypothetical protein ACFE89_04650, partial [Candidatus Hodarchaeota archaeon]
GMGGIMPEMGSPGSGQSSMTSAFKKMMEGGETGLQEKILTHRRLNLRVDDAGRRIPEIIMLVDKNGVQLEKVEMHKPTLDDVFLSVTGRSIRDEKGSILEMVRQRRVIRQARGQRTPH